MRGKTATSQRQLGAFDNEVEAMQRSGRLSAAEASELMACADML
jgi:hypothetical protein